MECVSSSLHHNKLVLQFVEHDTANLIISCDTATHTSHTVTTS